MLILCTCLATPARVLTGHQKISQDQQGSERPSGSFPQDTDEERGPQAEVTFPG